MIKFPLIEFPIRSVPQFSIQRLAFFSSFSSANSISLNSSTEEDEVENGDGGGGGATFVYQYALRRQRPSTIKWAPQLTNSVSLIGSVTGPLTRYKTMDDSFAGFTYLNVINPGDPHRTFRIQLVMRDAIAKTASQHIKRNDVIYVSGYLRSYKIDDETGNLSNYKIIVKELSYVAQPGKLPSIVKREESKSKAKKKSEAGKESEESLLGGGDTGIETSTSDLHSWVLFFCKPYEWWDKRAYKQNSSAPDFKHKYTGECLWLRPNDPPWIQKQLELLELKTAKQRQAFASETGMDECKNHHHLWQVFFRNPHEWWDNRKTKKHSWPDFKHKDTGEALWIKPNDPPWVKRQLQLLDSKMEEKGPGRNLDSSFRVSQWLPDD